MGVWIEMYVLPFTLHVILVTPFMGVWIEIVVPSGTFKFAMCHSLHGSVD